jgi:glycosyltransferase involved in cell wall biosynthesis
MRVLLVNKYFFQKGGAESVFFATADLLKKKGHDVRFFSMAHENNYPSDDGRYFVSKVDYEVGGVRDKARAAVRLLYSFEAKRKLRELLADARPDIAHLHNTYHQISPSILHVLKEFRIPVVMTLHDYKMVCGSYSMLSHGRICEKCKNGRYYHCLLEKCTKDSRLRSLLNVCEMYLHHRVLNIYDLVDCFVSPSKFLMNELVAMGFRRKTRHLPNFIDVWDPPGSRKGREEPIVVYFGRLSGEKGLSTLITAMKEIEGKTLHIVGDGPQRAELENRIAKEGITNVKLLGFKTGDALKGEIGRSMFGVIPSECFENNPMSVLELFSMGKPAIGSRIGGIPELIGDGERGLLCEPGDPHDLRGKIVSLLEDAEGLRRMGKNAKEYVERELNPEVHYKGLLEVYGEACASIA